MSESRLLKFPPWNDLLSDLQLVALSFLSLTDLEYFSYASWESRKLYSTEVDRRFRPEIEHFYQRHGISQRIPQNAFIRPSIIGKKDTFVLTTNMAKALIRLVGFLQHPLPDAKMKKEFARFTDDPFGSRYVRVSTADTNNIHILLPILHWNFIALGLPLSEDEKRIAFVTPEKGLIETRDFVSNCFLNGRIHNYREERLKAIADNYLQWVTPKIDEFGNHLMTLGLTSLFSRIKDRLQFAVLPEASPERGEAVRTTMDARSTFLGTLTSRSWSEKETAAKTALCDNDANLYICDKPMAEAVYRRICALTEQEAVFIHRALFSALALAQAQAPQPPHSRFDSVQLLQVLTALDDVAQTVEGNAFVQSLYDLNDDGSNDYKLAVFKYLLQGGQKFINHDLFSGQKLVEMFNKVCRLREASREHDLDPFVWTSLLLLLMSNFAKKETLDKRAAHFVETVIHLCESDVFLGCTMGKLESIIEDFVHSELNPQNHADPLLNHHCFLFNLDAEWISIKLVRIFNTPYLSNKHHRLYELFRPWWDRCQSEEERARYLPGMKQIVEGEHFEHIVSFFLSRDLGLIIPKSDFSFGIRYTSCQSKLLRPDSALWCLPSECLHILFHCHDASAPYNLRLFEGLACTNKTRALSRLQKLGPDFYILHQLVYNNNDTWLLVLLYMLTESLFDAVLARISPALHSQETLEVKVAWLERIFATMSDLPGLLLYLNHRETHNFYGKESVFDTIPGSVLATMRAIEYVSPPEMFSSPPSRGNLFDFVVRLVNSLRYYIKDREVQAIDMSGLIHFITQHLTDEKFLTFLRTINSFYGEAVNAVPDCMIKLEKYRLAQLVEDQRTAAAQSGHSPRLFTPLIQSEAAPAQDTSFCQPLRSDKL